MAKKEFSKFFIASLKRTAQNVSPLVRRKQKLQAEIAEREGVSVEVVDMRWAKPVDEQMVAEVAAKFRRVVTVEDGVVDGGAGSAVATMLAQMGYDGVVECLGIKDKFVQHASVAEQKAECEYDVEGIVKALLREKK